MRTRCPACGTTLSLDSLVAHEAAREALQAAFGLSGKFGSAMIRYLSLFRPKTRELTLDRLAKLLNELLPDILNQRINYDGAVYDAPTDAWIWAIEQAVQARDNGRLTTPLTGHGWLYKVIASWQPVRSDVVREDRTSGEKAASNTLRGLSELESLRHG